MRLLSKRDFLKTMMAVAFANWLVACNIPSNDPKEKSVTKVAKSTKRFHLPAEWEKHEGTWLQWPCDRRLPGYEMELERIWLTMVDILHGHENVHIVVCDEQHKQHVERQLKHYRIGPKNIDLTIIPTDDVWVRDNGPIFVKDVAGNLAITDWRFNGWGGRYEFRLDNEIPSIIGNKRSIPVLNPPMVLEGGAVDVNGMGTFLATRTSIINPNRNPELGHEEIEDILKEYFGVTHFIWLSGSTEDESESMGDVTDAHIDGAARFTGETTVLYNWIDDTSDPRYQTCKKQYEELMIGTTESGKQLTLVPLPLPEPGVYRTVKVESLSSTFVVGTYCNFYIANGVVLVPIYGNVNDERAMSIIAEQFPDREVIGINVLGLVDYGGAIHCVTQQQQQI